MRAYITLSLFILLLSAPQAAWSVTPDTYTVVTQANGQTGVNFTIGYTFGTHTGRSTQASGTVLAQVDPLVLSSGDLSVPIGSMTTGDPTRDCHMREALGIDYSHSRFPTDHVCVNNQTPPSGPDSIVFPNIGIKLVEIKPLDPSAAPSSARLVPGQETDMQASIDLSIHGITHQIQTPIRLSLDASSRVTVQAQFDVKIADYGIVVIPAGPIKVKDHATVTLNMLLAKQPAR